MGKGMFTQGVCVLLDRVPTLDEVQSTLADFEICNRVDSTDEWVFGGPTLIVEFRTETNGLVSVDIVDRAWPDHMGDSATDTTIFGGWAMGHFGPCTYPGGLERAAQQCWVWEPGRTIADQHKAFIRVRSSYAFGADEDQPLMPDDYDPIEELEFVTKVVTALLQVPGALCYFNPGGEVLRDEDGLRETLNHAWSHDFPPLDAWTNVRMFNVDAGWCMMDTVGNSQVDIPDVEACFHAESFDFGEVDNFLRNVSLYVLTKGDVIADGDTMDGPGDVAWQAYQLECGICDPPRPVLRWSPVDGRPLPAELVSSGDDE